MRITNRKWAKLMGLLLVVALVIPMTNIFAQEDMEEVELPEVDPLFVEGDIIIAGSSTVYPLTQAVAERFTEAGYGGQITIDSIGSGGGFERFCVAAETDISNASRPINEEEIAACVENGRTPAEFRVGTDALAVVVSAENDFVEELTIDQLGQIFAGGSNITWADINPEWPAEAIEVFSPGTDSGTYDYFVEEVMFTWAEAQGVADDEATEDDEVEVAANEGILNAGNISLSEDDNVLVQGVSANPYAIGYFGYAYYQENAEVLRAVAIDGVEPGAEAVEAGEYPLARPLFIYSATEVMAEKPQVAAFISYYLSSVNEEIVEVGYFPASLEALNNGKYMFVSAECTADAESELVNEELCAMAEEMMMGE